MAGKPGIREILKIYAHNSLLTRLHVGARFITCPFLTIEQFVPREGVIVDYGCGHGVFAHLLAMTSSKRKIYAFDISPTKMEEAVKTCRPNAAVDFIDKLDIDKHIGEADCIIALDVLCYLSARQRKVLLDSIFKNLKKGAKLIIKDIAKLTSLRYLWLYLQEVIVVKLLKLTYANALNFFKPHELCYLLRRIGFDVQIFNLNHFYPHVLYVCKKSKS